MIQVSLWHRDDLSVVSAVAIRRSRKARVQHTVCFKLGGIPAKLDQIRYCLSTHMTYSGIYICFFAACTRSLLPYSPHIPCLLSLILSLPGVDLESSPHLPNHKSFQIPTTLWNQSQHYVRELKPGIERYLISCLLHWALRKDIRWQNCQDWSKTTLQTAAASTHRNRWNQNLLC